MKQNMGKKIIILLTVILAFAVEIGAKETGEGSRAVKPRSSCSRVSSRASRLANAAIVDESSLRKA